MGLLRTAPLLLVAGLVTACSMPAFTAPAGTRTFQVGYHDGCDAGYAIAGSPVYQRVERVAPQNDDPQYRAGWGAGYASCKVRYDRIQNTLNAFIGS